MFRYRVTILRELLEQKTTSLILKFYNKFVFYNYIIIFFPARAIQYLEQRVGLVFLSSRIIPDDRTR